MIERLLNGPPIVLATGGETFHESETRALMKEKATTVWLRADLDVIWKRVNRRDTRLLLKRDNQAGAGRSRCQACADLRRGNLVIDSDEGPSSDG